MRLPKLEILMAVMVPLVWGMGFVFAKAAIAQFPPILLMALRFAVTAMALVWFTKIPIGNLRRLFFIAMIGAAIQVLSQSFHERDKTYIPVAFKLLS